MLLNFSKVKLVLLFLALGLLINGIPHTPIYKYKNNLKIMNLKKGVGIDRNCGLVAKASFAWQQLEGPTSDPPS